MKADVFLYVQHLLGIGHLQRASLLAKAMDKAGLKVIFAAGGRPVPYLDIGHSTLLQLPSLHAADNSFKILKNSDGIIVDDNWKSVRKEQLLKAFQDANPKVLLLEMFPFGRRQMRFELDPLIELAKSKGIPVVTSVRDILTTHKTPGKSEWIIERVKQDIDHVLVHGDQDFISLEESFPLAKEIRNKIIYTGYVVEPSSGISKSKFPPQSRRGVLVSAGGGAVALPLARAAIKAKELSTLSQVPWRLLLGDNLPKHEFENIARQAPGGMTVERNRSDFQDLLRSSQLSISQAGYNTILETLTSSTPAIVVPFAADSQSEQTTRAQKLEALGALTMLSERSLSPKSLAEAIDKATKQTQTEVDLGINGASNTAKFIRNLIKGRDF